MREIADLGAGAFQDLAVGVEQKVQLARERRHVPRVLAPDPLGLALPDRPDRTPQPHERLQAEADLQERRQAEKKAETGEGRCRCAQMNSSMAASISSAGPATRTMKRPSSPRSMSRSTSRSVRSSGAWP